MSAVPDPYTRQADFTDHSTESPNTPHSGVDLDAEFDAIKTLFDAMQARAAEIQRDDGQLRNGIVTLDSLADEVILGFGTPVDWEDGLALALNATVVYDNKIWLVTTAHAASSYSGFQEDNFRLLFENPDEESIDAAVAAGVAEVEEAVDAAVAAFEAEGITNEFQSWSFTSSASNILPVAGAVMTDINAYLIFFNGVRKAIQIGGSYEYSIDVGTGQITALTIGAVPSNGVVVSIVCLGYPVAGVGANSVATAAIQDNAVTAAKLGGSGMVLKSEYTVNYTPTSSGAANIPIDGTDPEITEGVQLLSNSFTATSTSNTGRFRAVIHGKCSSDADVVVALFSTNGVSSTLMHAQAISVKNGDRFQIAMQYEGQFTSSTLTYVIRGGAADSADSISFNPNEFGSLICGSSFTIEEIKA